MYSVGEHEIDMLSASYGSIYQTALGISSGVTLTCGVVLLTVNLSDRAFGAFIGGAVAAGIAAIVLLGLAVVEYRTVHANIKRIKER